MCHFGWIQYVAPSRESHTTGRFHGIDVLVGNDGYRRYLATPRDGHFDIDDARIAEDARFDGLQVLRINSTLPMLSVALAYLELWRIEAIFRTANSIFETRPIFHQSDAAIAGLPFCSFLALLLRKELYERLTAAGVEAEWGGIVRDLDRVEELTVEQGPKHFVLRAHAPGCAGVVFKAVGVGLPPMMRQVPTGTPPPTPAAPSSPPRRRGPPWCGATLLWIFQIRVLCRMVLKSDCPT
jgi:hypothetical protein